MDDLVNNIVYLIPIAFFIAIRIIGAKNKQAGDQQKKDSTGELIKKTHEAQTNPAYRKALEEAREVYIPSVASREARPVMVQQPKKPGEVKKKAKKPPAAPPKKDGFKSIFPETADIKVSESSAETAAAKTKDTSAAKTVQDLQSLITGPGRTPLQQAVVWSEILGQPRGLSAP